MQTKGLNEDKNRQRISREQLLTIGDLEDFRVSLIDEIKRIIHESGTQSMKQWLKSAEVRKMLVTLQKKQR